MISSSKERVPRHTSPSDQRAIAQTRASSIRYFAAHPHEIERRLEELDKEWDIERAIEMNASALAFTGVAAGILHDKRWLILPALVTGFLFQHAVQGWCPPVPVLRKLGFRTVYEIEQERYALKALRSTPKPRARRRSVSAKRTSANRRARNTAKAA